MELKENSYPSKILLFGEYGVLLGLDALAMPLSLYSGQLDSKEAGVDVDLVRFLAYLKKIKPTIPYVFHIDLLEADINKGLCFKSNIPLHYGLGSSGALVAAIFEKYSEPSKRNPQTDIRALKTTLALIESYFHGQSSGIDPLVSLLKYPVLVSKTGSVVRIKKNILPPEPKLQLFLVDSQVSGKTGDLVEQFMKRLEEKDFSESFRGAYRKYSNAAISHLLNKQFDDFVQCFRELSNFQLSEMSELIPDSIKEYFQMGISSGNYSLKLCGSGGGGFFLGISTKKEIVEKEIKLSVQFL